ncbi:MAG: hypothetical protein A2046_11145 [Bacteroidetes bacterium GWA2_30_7]|nr:MAG: hypothetical protein A2046_11145 [Bacteroidetes bacterium GWA2_30_7]
MSIPINHHYVSQCQIKNFFNYEEGKIYLYDKLLKNQFESKSTKRVFSEDESNSRVVNKQIDHLSLEKDLKDNYEDFFSKNFEIVNKQVSNPQNELSNIKKALIELTKYGIAGEIRNPIKKKESDNAITNFLFNQILPNADPKLKKEIEDLKSSVEQTKYINAIYYSEFVENVFKSMGGVNCVIYLIKCNHFFILPDRPSISKREKINEYFNPDIKEIAMVGIPLSSKIFLHSESQKHRKYKDTFVELTEQNVSIIEQINFLLYVNAYKQVACQNKGYLANFVSNIEHNKKIM